jgi:ethanolamine utilization protein EutA
VGSSSAKTHNKDAVTMIGLDFGSTTSSAIVAHAHVARSSVTGRMNFGAPEIRYRSEPVFTPFTNNTIDESLLQNHLDGWLEESGIVPEQLFSGGAIITGLATEAENAGRITQLVKQRVGEAIIATASDPCLESWLAFMGSCSALSRCNPDHQIINFDIGGGTTNPALGKNGVVHETGCYFIGARHFQFTPGTYTLTAISTYGQILLDHFGISKTPGETLTATERETILDFYQKLLESVVAEKLDPNLEPAATAHTQIPLTLQDCDNRPIITFSGGVGELIYHYSMGKALPNTTHFGDLGIDIAVRIAESPLLASSLSEFVPENMGRATVYGLAIHSTEISGATLFLPKGEILSLHDLPIVGKITMDEDATHIEKLFTLVSRNRGGAIQILSSQDDDTKHSILQGPFVEKHQRIKSLGEKIANILQAVAFPPDTPLVLLAPGNYGKSLGNYATNWKQLNLKLVVIDEIPDRNAHFVNIGRIHNNIVPVSFYGVQ